MESAFLILWHNYSIEMAWVSGCLLAAFANRRELWNFKMENAMTESIMRGQGLEEDGELETP